MVAGRTPPRAFVACLVAALLATPVTAATAAPRADRVERAVLRRLNDVRAAHRLPSLRPDPRLERGADFHTRDMLAADFFAHTSSDGESMAGRVGGFRPSHRLGEVLAYVPSGRPRRQAALVVRLWMASPGHRDALLTRAFRRVGVARRTGRLGGLRVTVFTADLSSRR